MQTNLRMSGDVSDIAQATLQSQTIINTLVLNLLVQNGLADRDKMIAFLEDQGRQHSEATEAILKLVISSLAEVRPDAMDD